ncbi:MAG TPA: toll/interleukin-1 receptor domain-containing protein, partial [Methylomirabilota bacterium]|nr:toll/interleukin-1 receptor domain-containing protein [Methylomirabilota bacterium]
FKSVSGERTQSQRSIRHSQRMAISNHLLVKLPPGQISGSNQGCHRLHSLAISCLIYAQASFNIDVDAWWNAAQKRDSKLAFPSNPDEEMILRYHIIEKAAENTELVFRFGVVQGQHKHDGRITIFRTLIVRPFVEDLSHRLGEAADLATPEARAMQAVPLSRIPSPKEVKIFLSHKSVDKPLVYRYYNALKALGFDPWLDESDMPAGANLEREVLRGFEESCAAVFFITENFKDERYLATEVDYAVLQKRKKDKKFAIITLRYTNAAPVPGLLIPYIYKDVANDLEGFNELVSTTTKDRKKL